MFGGVFRPPFFLPMTVVKPSGRKAGMTVAVLLITPVVFMRESKNGLFVVFRRRYTGIVPDDGLEKGPLKDFFLQSAESHSLGGDS